MGDRYTLLFGKGSIHSENPALAGQPTGDSPISWIPVDSVKIKKLTIYGELYPSKDLGVTVKSKKQGVKVDVKSHEYSRTAGVIVEFNSIGKVDIYTVFTVTHIYSDLEKTFSVLCVNRSIDIGGESLN